jgi:hypothetical protein
MSERPETDSFIVLESKMTLTTLLAFTSVLHLE